MTPAELARHSAISFECKKHRLLQMQNGDWRVTFTLQGIDMDERLTKAVPGTRYMAVLVEVGADELPVHQPAKESKNPPVKDPATPSQGLDKPLEKAKRMDWRELQPAAQAGIRCSDQIFISFLKEQYEPYWIELEDAADVVRSICAVRSRTELNTVHACRMLWKQLDEEFSIWKMKERVGA